MGKRERVLFLDIDGVFTTEGKPEERRVLDSTVQMLVKAREAGYTKFVFITARAAPWVQKEFLPKIEKFGLMPSSEFHCENGLYRIMPGGKIAYAPEAAGFLGVKKTVETAIETEIKAMGINASNATEKAGKLVQVRFVPNSAEAAKPLGEAIAKVINRLKLERLIPRDVEGVITKSGVNIFPYSVNKGSTARRIVSRWQAGTGNPRVRIKAIGDVPIEDGLMKDVPGAHGKFRMVENAGQFMHLMTNLTISRDAARRIKRTRKTQNWEARRKANLAKKQRRRGK
jgi:hydroxymethylpyrimidine pyrophosphatase-like HAD family hydrolase